MPEQFRGFGIELLYPETWKHETDENTVTLESPQGAFLSVNRVSDTDPSTAVQSVVEAMQQDYEDIESESTSRTIGGRQLNGVTLRFVYLDLIVVSQILSFSQQGATFVIQLQAEDRDMQALASIFDAILTSMMQSL